MSRRVLMEIVREKTGCTHVVARGTVQAVLLAISNELKARGRCVLSGFGVFTVRKMKARMGMNPATGDVIKIKATKTVRFRASPRLRKAV